MGPGRGKEGEWLTATMKNRPRTRHLCLWAPVREYLDLLELDITIRKFGERGSMPHSINQIRRKWRVRAILGELSAPPGKGVVSESCNTNDRPGSSSHPGGVRFHMAGDEIQALAEFRRAYCQEENKRAGKSPGEWGQMLHYAGSSHGYGTQAFSEKLTRCIPTQGYQ